MCFVLSTWASVLLDGPMRLEAFDVMSFSKQATSPSQRVRMDVLGRFVSGDESRPSSPRTRKD